MGKITLNTLFYRRTNYSVKRSMAEVNAQVNGIVIGLYRQF